MSRKFALCAGLLAAASVSQAFAQEDLLSELYGVGVHAYYASDYRDAYENLTAAIEGGTRDPRAYYFRGLALSQLGRPEDARLDFAKGAQLEVAGGGDRYPIGRALERVQGVQRLTIERVRQIEKIKYQQAQLAESKRRYEDRQQIQAQEPVLRPTTPADVPPPSKVVDEGVVPAGAEGDPFGDDGLGVGTAEPAPERPTTPADVGVEEGAPESEDPFGTETPAEPAVGGGDDPFGGEPTAEPAGDDPFGGEPAGEEPAPAGDDPFGEAPAEVPAAGEEPAEEPAGDDPFGEAPAAEPAAPAGDDPFGEAPTGGEKPEMEEEPAADDPFGAAPDAGAEEPAAGGDPFGAAPAAEEPAAGGDPFGAAPAAGVGDVIRGVGAAIGEVGEGAADGRDPFDDSDEPKPAVKPTPPAAEEPDDAADDPFADDAEAPAAVADDPFAN